jgi:hypothetical protein
MLLTYDPAEMLFGQFICLIGCTAPKEFAGYSSTRHEPIELLLGPAAYRLPLLSIARPVSPGRSFVFPTTAPVFARCVIPDATVQKVPEC